jgi:uncharacterized membrane protein YfcA
MFDLANWFLFPVAVLVSGVSVAAGVGGGLLYAPILIFVFGVEPLVAFAIALVLELFGFSSGFIQYARRRSIDFSLVKKLIVFSLPATVIGVWLSRVLSIVSVQIILAGTLTYLGLMFLKGHIKTRPKHPHFTGLNHPHPEVDVTSTVKASTFFGGGLVGLLSGGLGEINEYNFLTKIGLKPAHSAATSVALVSASALVGILCHAWLLLNERGLDVFSSTWPFMIYGIPGVLIGAGLGVRVATHLGVRHLKFFLAGLFLLSAIIVLVNIK